MATRAATKMCLACSKEYFDDIEVCPDDGTHLILLARTDPFLDSLINQRYLVCEVIGKGGTGVTYLAKRGEKVVAVKVHTFELQFESKEHAAEWRRDGIVMLGLDHPNILKMLDFGFAQTGQLYRVFEYLEDVPENRSLWEEIHARGPIEAELVAPLFAQLADALEHAHEKQIFHRDIKLSNIILRGNTPQLTDFEFARSYAKLFDSQTKCQCLDDIFQFNVLFGSPEMCMGKPLGPTSDLYMLTICLFAALSGKLPFRGENRFQVASKQMTDPVPSITALRPDLNIPAAFEGFFIKSLAKKPEERYQTPREWKEALLSI